MKFLWWLFLIVQIETHAEPSSLSFINIIPSLIENSRFIQEYMIVSNFSPDRKLPFINIDLLIKENISNCSSDMQLLTNDINAGQLWALKTFDAWGKLPSGIMQGNIYWVGSSYECQHSLRGLNNSVLLQPMQTRTCTIGSGLSTRIRPVYSVCVPQSCNSSDIVRFVNQGVIRIPSIGKPVNLTNDDVYCLTHRQFDSQSTLTIVSLSVIAAFILLATGLHAIYGKKHDIKTDDAHLIAASETALTQTTAVTTVLTTNPLSRPNTTDEREISTTSDDIPLVVPPAEPNVDKVALSFIGCCSLINSYRILVSKNYPKNLACLNGIRVLSLCWIILGHTFIFAAYYSDNVMTIFNWSRQLWFQFIIQTFFSFDSFFLWSGILTAFTYFVSKVENERYSCIKFILDHYVYHYLRYTPLYGFILLIYITLSPYMGQDGPVYPMYGTETSTCRHTWWRNLLYINNFFDMRDSCMPISWFLAVNMQFHWITPLFLFTVSWKWLVGILVCVLLVLVDVISTLVIVSKNNYEYGLLTEFYFNNSGISNMSNGYLNDVYVKPWCRIAPYALGLSIGYIFYEIYQRANIISWDSFIPRTTIHGRHYFIRRIFAWAVALAILSLCIFGTYGDYSGHSLTRQNRIAFITLSRLGWSAGLCIIVITCFAGHGMIINRFLSQPCFYTLSKLTYGAYLWHALVIFVNYLSRDQPTHYTITNIFSNFVYHTMLSYTLSFFSFLLIEVPIIQLLEFGFQHSTKLR